MVFQWSLSDSKSPQVSRTLLSIQAVLNNAVVWMVSTCPPTSKSPTPFSNPLFTVPNAPITIGVIVTFMFHSFFFQFPSKVKVLILLFIFFQFYSVVNRVLLLLLLLYSSLRVFHTSVNWWFLTGETASLIKSPGFFSVFGPILIIL